MNSPADFRKFICCSCGLIYDEALGMPEEGIAAGTHWEDVPQDWECPVCGMRKADFSRLA